MWGRGTGRRLRTARSPLMYDAEYPSRRGRPSLDVKPKQVARCL
jgi:hypothetical protein